MTVTAVDLLKTAIKNWETKGWIQGRSRNEVGATCSSGGIEMAALSQVGNNFFDAAKMFSLQGAFSEANVAFRDAIENRDNRGIVTWNDEPSRTIEDVILTAKRAIEKLEALEVER